MNRQPCQAPSTSSSLALLHYNFAGGCTFIPLDTSHHDDFSFGYAAFKCSIPKLWKYGPSIYCLSSYACICCGIGVFLRVPLVAEYSLWLFCPTIPHISSWSLYLCQLEACHCFSILQPFYVIFILCKSVLLVFINCCPTNFSSIHDLDSGHVFVRLR